MKILKGVKEGDLIVFGTTHNIKKGERILVLEEGRECITLIAIKDINKSDIILDSCEAIDNTYNKLEEVAYICTENNILSLSRVIGKVSYRKTELQENIYYKCIDRYISGIHLSIELSKDLSFNTKEVYTEVMKSNRIPEFIREDFKWRLERIDDDIKRNYMYVELLRSLVFVYKGDVCDLVNLAMRLQEI